MDAKYLCTYKINKRIRRGRPRGSFTLAVSPFLYFIYQWVLISAVLKNAKKRRGIISARKVHKRAVISGDVVEIYTYESPYLSGYTREIPLFYEENGKKVYYRIIEETGEVQPINWGRNIIDEPSMEQKKINRKKVLYRAKNKLRRLINANVFSWTDSKGKLYIPKFVTLTFKDNKTDVKECNRLFKQFIKRLNRYIRKTVGDDAYNIQYVSVIEFQERGAVHYHAIFFNCPYIDFHTFLEIWKYGGGWLEAISNKNTRQLEKKNSNSCHDSIMDIGAYLTKTMEYMTKAENDERLKGQKCYLVTKGLKKSQVIEEEKERYKKRVTDLADSLPIKNMTYTKNYQCDYLGKITHDEYNRKYENPQTKKMDNILSEKISDKPKRELELLGLFETNNE